MVQLIYAQNAIQEEKEKSPPGCASVFGKTAPNNVAWVHFMHALTWVAELLHALYQFLRVEDIVIEPFFYREIDVSGTCS